MRSPWGRSTHGVDKAVGRIKCVPPVGAQMHRGDKARSPWGCRRTGVDKACVPRGEHNTAG